MAEQHAIGGRQRERITGRLFPGEMRRLLHQLPRLHAAELSEGAVGCFVAPDPLRRRQERIAAIALLIVAVVLIAMDDDLVADFPAFDLGADRPDNAGRIRAGNVKGMLVPVQRRHRHAKPGPNAVVVDAAGHDIDQHLLLSDRPGRDDLALHRRFRRSVPFLADRPGIHFRWDVTEWRHLTDLVKVLNGRGGRNFLGDGHSGAPRLHRHALADQKIGKKRGPGCNDHFAAVYVALQQEGRHTFPCSVRARRDQAMRDSEPGDSATGAKAGASRERPMPETLPDKPWIFRTYAGHSTATASNALYRTNLSKGQTGLSVAFDLPTQTGYDSDHPLAKGEVGKVGVPICHLGDMRALFESIPLGEMNTSMTINATAAWLLALYIAVADEQNVPRAKLQGTTQNDIIKEYLSRGTYVFPPAPSMRLTKDVNLFTTKEMPKWNPINVCSYHLQEAGATPVQELAFALATPVGVLDAVKASRQCADEEFGDVVGRISFFVNAGLRFVTEVCKMRAFTELWNQITRERYGVRDAKQRLFRYGVQVNSLGLTEQQPENNVARILIEMLAVTLSKDARARAVQLPAWNEALGLPRPWDQQWSLRMQQILAFETDLLEYGDIFKGSPAIAAKVDELKSAAREELNHIEALGGTVAAVESGYLKAQLVESNSRRVEAIERGEQTVVGVNRFIQTEPSPLAAAAGAVLTVSDEAETDQVARLQAWRDQRDGKAVAAALEKLRQAAKSGANIMPASITCAKAGVTTGEWGAALRAAFGEYRAPTGVGTAMRNDAEGLDDIRAAVDRVSKKLGRRLKFLVGKPGLDGHSNGAEQIAARARDAGMDVVYDGIRLTAEAIAAAARENKVHVVGLSILSGSHLPLVHEVMARLHEHGVAQVPVVVGGIIPPQDARALKDAGVAEVYTPKNFELNRIMFDLVRIVEGAVDATK